MKTLDHLGEMHIHNISRQVLKILSLKLVIRAVMST